MVQGSFLTLNELHSLCPLEVRINWYYLRSDCIQMNLKKKKPRFFLMDDLLVRYVNSLLGLECLRSFSDFSNIILEKCLMKLI